MIKENDFIKGIGLILMFTLGWIASDLFAQIDCGECKDMRKSIEQRMNRYNQQQKKYLEMQRYRPENNNERPKQFRERRVRPQVHEEVPPLGVSLV